MFFADPLFWSTQPFRSMNTFYVSTLPVPLNFPSAPMPAGSVLRSTSLQIFQGESESTKFFFAPGSARCARRQIGAMRFYLLRPSPPPPSLPSLPFSLGSMSERVFREIERRNDSHLFQPLTHIPCLPFLVFAHAAANLPTCIFSPRIIPSSPRRDSAEKSARCRPPQSPRLTGAMSVDGSCCFIDGGKYSGRLHLDMI
jgi:hypothetical protein